MIYSLAFLFYLAKWKKMSMMTLHVNIDSRKKMFEIEINHIDSLFIEKVEHQLKVSFACTIKTCRNQLALRFSFFSIFFAFGKSLVQNTKRISTTLFVWFMCFFPYRSFSFFYEKEIYHSEMHRTFPFLLLKSDWGRYKPISNVCDYFFLFYYYTLSTNF